MIEIETNRIEALKQKMIIAEKNRTAQDSLQINDSPWRIRDLDAFHHKRLMANQKDAFLKLYEATEEQFKEMFNMLEDEMIPNMLEYAKINNLKRKDFKSESWRYGEEQPNTK